MNYHALRYVPRRRQGPLNCYARRVASQFGEDGIIEEIFKRIGISSQYCVEFGAGDGQNLSNSWMWLYEQGWAGTLIEPDVQQFDVMKTRYAGRGDIHLICKLISTDSTSLNSLDNILSKTGAPAGIDLMSIDVDGLDWHIWDSLKKFRPRVVIIECNPNIPNDVVFVQANDPSYGYGNSAAAFVELAKMKGYELVAALCVNLIFVAHEEFSKVGIEDNSLDTIADFHRMQSAVFQAGDTLMVVGSARPLWGGALTDLRVCAVPLQGFPSLGFGESD